jgi:hypothetical protein
MLERQSIPFVFLSLVTFLNTSHGTVNMLYTSQPVVGLEVLLVVVLEIVVPSSSATTGGGILRTPVLRHESATGSKDEYKLGNGTATARAVVVVVVVFVDDDDLIV